MLFNREIFKASPDSKMTVGKILKDSIPAFHHARVNPAEKVAAANTIANRTWIQHEAAAREAKRDRAHVQRDYRRGEGRASSSKRTHRAGILDDRQLTNEEVLVQVPTFPVAGH
ncbi:hypothetical protein V8D89_001574 [Ganoderma adspersum]